MSLNNSIVTQSIGIPYQQYVTSSAGHTSVSSSTYFNDTSDNIPRYKDASGNIYDAIISSSYALTASHALNSGGGDAFPFTGDASITGSLIVSGSFVPHGNGPTSNVMIGNLAGNSITSGGINNVYIGQEAGEAAGSGDANVVIGWKAGEASTNDSGCILIGFKAGGASTLGNYNTFLGYEAGRDATSTAGNIGIGFQALFELNAGGGSGYNTALGWKAGHEITSGDYNLFIGYEAGYDITTGANNIIIGSGSKGEAAITNQLRIGHSDLTVISASLSTGDIIFASTASATYFVGDGSQLTNLQRPISSSVSTNVTASNLNSGYYFRAGGNVTCSIQTNASVPCNVGSEFEFFQTSSAGNMLFLTGSGVTLNSKSGNITLTGQFSAATLKKVDNDEWDLIGDLS